MNQIPALIRVFAYLSLFLPTALLALVVGRVWMRLQKWLWRASIQRGLAPVSIGLLLAGCFTMANGAVTGAITSVIALVVFEILLRSKINPALLVLGGALVGLFAFGLK